MLGSFKRNIAHSYRVGVLGHDIDAKAFDKRTQVTRKRDAVTHFWYKQVDDVTPGLRRVSKLEDTLTYANSESGGIFAECGHLHIAGLTSIRQPSGLEALLFFAEQWHGCRSLTYVFQTCHRVRELCRSHACVARRANCTLEGRIVQ